MAKLSSVNIGNAHPLDNAKSGMTGIFKEPVEVSVNVTVNGLETDVICDSKNHGGPDQAVYVYSVPDYEWWADTLRQELKPGTFGENLTFTELSCDTLSIGDRFLIGSVVLEVTAPRIPCVTLARRMNDTDFVKKFIAAERPGVYCRVLQEGILHVGDSVEVVSYAGETVSVMELMRDFYAPDLREEAIRRFLAAPIAIRARLHKEKQLDDLLAR